MEPGKTHKTAVVVIPPGDMWEPIQAIRRRYDRQVRRWMPHITLLYPFRPRAAFGAVEPALREACGGVGPFEIHLGALRHFRHGRGRFTLWLAPEPPEGLVALHAALCRAVPDCDDTSRFEHGFMPHLSVGQVYGVDRLAEIRRDLQESWGGVGFVAERVSLVARGEPPEDVFRVDRELPLGR